jgi:hypothetical protein
MQIKSITQLREKKELKKEQIEYIKSRLYYHRNQFDYKQKQVKDGYNWIGKLLWGIEIFRQGKRIIQRVKGSRK